MKNDEITALFDQQASGYDQQWSHLEPIHQALHLLTGAILEELGATAHILCVGAGTGAEILALARRFPGWRFTAVEPSRPMLEILRRKADEQGILSRCVLHAGYLDSLPLQEPFDAATAFLVSHFLLERDVREGFFRGIARRLRPGGVLVSSDLSGDLETMECQDLLKVWFRLMTGGGMPAEGVDRLRQAYTRDVAVRPPDEVREILIRGGFEAPVAFFQAGMIRAWYAKLRADGPGAGGDD